MPERSAMWLDGEPTTTLPLPDRGLDFGDGLFETLLLLDGKPLYKQHHLERLEHGLQVLGFPQCMPDVIDCLDLVVDRSQELDYHWAVMRMSVTRGMSPRGYAPPLVPQPRVLIRVTAMERDCGAPSKAATLALAAVQISIQPMLAGVKHLNRLEQVLAAATARAEGADEALLLDQSGLVNSVAAGNVFALCGGRLLTPALHNCGVAGTRRRLIMEDWAPALGLSVVEVELSLDELHLADEVFYTNSLHTVRPVTRLGEHCWQDHGLANALFQRFQAELA